MVPVQDHALAHRRPYAKGRKGHDGYDDRVRHHFMLSDLIWRTRHWPFLQPPCGLNFLGRITITRRGKLAFGVIGGVVFGLRNENTTPISKVASDPEMQPMTK